jgi:ribosome-associated protein
MLKIDSNISFDENKIIFETFRSSGPGGQNVNKVSTAVRLRFSLNNLDLPIDILQRLKRIAGKRLTQENEILIEAQRFRTQEKNRQDAINRLIQLIKKALVKPKKRVKTKPTKESREKRLTNKKHRSNIKNSRGKVQHD